MKKKTLPLLLDRGRGLGLVDDITDEFVELRGLLVDELHQGITPSEHVVHAGEPSLEVVGVGVLLGLFLRLSPVLGGLKKSVPDLTNALDRNASEPRGPNPNARRRGGGETTASRGGGGDGRGRRGCSGASSRAGRGDGRGLGGGGGLGGGLGSGHLGLSVLPAAVFGGGTPPEATKAAVFAIGNTTDPERLVVLLVRGEVVVLTGTSLAAPLAAILDGDDPVGRFRHQLVTSLHRNKYQNQLLPS